jgi:pyridoxamine 5'-phosphate oxidase
LPRQGGRGIFPFRREGKRPGAFQPESPPDTDPFRETGGFRDMPFRSTHRTLSVARRAGSFVRALFTAGKAVTLGLSEESAGTDPLALFSRWYRDAERSGLLLPESMALATATPEGRPSIRFVLLKAFDERGFVFYSNYGSRKAGELQSNPEASLIFHWAALQRQVRLEGPVSRVARGESEAYFRTRPRGSQIGAWASAQSEPLRSRSLLEDRVRRYEEEFRGGEVPLPPFWGGYRLEPRTMEFWQGRANRLHDRIHYTWRGETWERGRLYP